MTYFVYRSKKNSDKSITIAHNGDGTLSLTKGNFANNQENIFHTIEDIEEFLDDELEMIIRSR